MTDKLILDSTQQENHQSVSNLENCDFKFNPNLKDPLNNTKYEDFTLIGNLKQISLEGNSLKKHSDIFRVNRLYGILNNSLVMFKSQNTFDIESKVDINLAKFYEISQVSSKNINAEAIFGFALVKGNQKLIFITESDLDIQTWRQSFGSYVILRHIERNYNFKQMIGEGANAKVFLGQKIELKDPQRQGSSQRVAIKRIDKSRIFRNNQGITNLLNEIKIHQTLKACGNILQLLEIYEDEAFVYLVLEYQRLGTLQELIISKKIYKESQIKSIMEQLLLCLDFVHNKNIIHRDIKIENILIHQIDEDQYEIRIADFGIASFITDNELLYLRCGTPGNCAPEVLNGSGYNPKSDIFSLGVVFYNLATGKYLFDGKSQEEVIKLNMECDSQMVSEKIGSACLSQSGIDLLKSMLQKDCSRRPCAKQALEHNWFKKDQLIIKELLDINNSLCNPLANNERQVISRQISSIFCRHLLANDSLKLTKKISDKSQNDQFEEVSLPKIHLNYPNINNNSTSSCGYYQQQCINYFNALKGSSSKLILNSLKKDLAHISFQDNVNHTTFKKSQFQKLGKKQHGKNEKGHSLEEINLNYDPLIKDQALLDNRDDNQPLIEQCNVNKQIKDEHRSSSQDSSLIQIFDNCCEEGPINIDQQVILRQCDYMPSLMQMTNKNITQKQRHFIDLILQQN